MGRSGVMKTQTQTHAHTHRDKCIKHRPKTQQMMCVPYNENAVPYTHTFTIPRGDTKLGLCVK